MLNARDYVTKVTNTLLPKLRRTAPMQPKTEQPLLCARANCPMPAEAGSAWCMTHEPPSHLQQKRANPIPQPDHKEQP